MKKTNEIGTLICEARKIKNYSQEYLARKLNVSRQAISNWENNKSLPDINIIMKLCKILNIDFNKFINSSNNEFNIEEIVTNEKINLIRKNRKLFIALIIIFLTIIGVLVVIYNQNTFEVYDVNIDSEEFNLKNSILIKSKVKNYFKLGVLQSKNNTNNNIKYFVKIYSRLNGKEKIIIESEYEDDLSVIEDYGYDEYFSDRQEKLDNIYIDIKYNDNNRKYIFTYKMNFNLNFKSKKILYLKGNKISDNDNFLTDNKIDINKNNLIENNYIFNEDNNSYEKVHEQHHYVYSPESNSLIYSFSTEKYDILTEIDLNKKEVFCRKYNYDNEKIDLNFNYNIDENKVICYTHDCSDYKNYIKNIIEEMEILTN